MIVPALRIDGRCRFAELAQAIADHLIGYLRIAAVADHVEQRLAHDHLRKRRDHDRIAQLGAHLFGFGDHRAQPVGQAQFVELARGGGHHPAGDLVAQEAGIEVLRLPGRPSAAARRVQYCVSRASAALSMATVCPASSRFASIRLASGSEDPSPPGPMPTWIAETPSLPLPGWKAFPARSWYGRGFPADGCRSRP
jgi:hypothetical protein